MEDLKPGDVRDILIRGARIEDVGGDMVTVDPAPESGWVMPFDLHLVDNVTISLPGMTMAHAVTAREGRDTRIVAAHVDLDEARRLMAATKRSEPDADYEVVPVPVVTHLPQVQPLHRCYADIHDDGEIHYDLVEQPHAFGFPRLNGYPAADDVRVEDVAGGDPDKTYILVDGWDRAKVWERIQAEAERISAEKTNRPEPPPWACPKCRRTSVELVTMPRRVAWGQGTKMGLSAPQDEPQRLRCEKCRAVYPIPAGVEIEGL